MEVLVGPNTSTASARGGLFYDGEEKERVGLEEDGLSSSSSSSSSIGAPDDDSEEEEDSVVSSKASGGALDSLEDSLPFKRGLSNYFSGKSKSFGNLAEVSLVVENVKGVEKPGNPFNKKRRILLANKWASSSKKSSFYTWHNPKSMPLLTLHEDHQEEQLVQQQEEENHPVMGLPILSSGSFSSCSSTSSSSSMEKNVPDPETGKVLLRDRWGVPLPPARLEVRS